ncbi:MAG: VanZ family protein [Pseudomonas sp.]
MYKLVSATAICLFIFMVWIIYLANTGSSSVFFDFVRSIPYGDKLGHLGLFGFLTLLAVIGSRFRTFALGTFRLYYGAAVVALFAIGEELSQAFIPSRTFDLLDLAANSVGIVLAVCVTYLMSKCFTNSAS